MPKGSVMTLLEMLFINVVAPPRRPKWLSVFQYFNILFRQRGAVKTIKKLRGYLVFLDIRSMLFKDLQYVGEAVRSPTTISRCEARLDRHQILFVYCEQ